MTSLYIDDLSDRRAAENARLHALDGDAAKVMGWPFDLPPAARGVRRWYRIREDESVVVFDGSSGGTDWRPSVDIGDAWDLVEHLQSATAPAGVRERFEEAMANAGGFVGDRSVVAERIARAAVTAWGERSC